MSSLQQFMNQPLADYLMTSGYRSHIESMKMILRVDPNTVRRAIPPDIGYVFRGNLTGLLLELGLLPKYHFIVMRVNDLTSIHQCDEHLGSLYIPAIQQMDQVMRLYEQFQNKN